ncbi:MAG: two-component system response regulator, partial [Gammaproteobacteria bacterium]
MTDIELSKPTILIVDDDPAIRLLMSHALSGSDLNIIEAESGEQAIEKFKEYSPELTLLDVTMAGIDGFECCTEIRELPNGSHAAIVMVTGLDQPQDIEKAFHVGATDFMTKPLKWPIFSHRVRYILKANQTLRELSLHKDMLANAQSIAHLGYWQWDYKTPVFQCSDELYRLMGLEPQQQEITYASTLRCVHPEDRATFMNAIRSALHDKQSYDLEYRIVQKNGDVLTLHHRTDVTQLYGQWLLTGTLHDITNRKQSEQKISYYA